MMRQNIARKVLTVGLLIGLTGLSAQADLGLSQILSSEGAKAVGVAVKAEAVKIYGSADDKDVIQAQLAGLLDEAAATGDKQAVRYAIVAVMIAGGMENLELSKAAIDDSDVLTQFPKETASTVFIVAKMMSEKYKERGGNGNQFGGGSGGESGGDDELGGDDWYWDLFDLDINDLDCHATKT